MNASPSRLRRTTALITVAVSATGAPTAALVIHPVAGVVLVAAQIFTVASVIATALYCSHCLSERAFRLLRLLTNRPEPPTQRRSSSIRTGSTTPSTDTET